MSGELIKVGKYDLKYNKILDIDIAELDIYIVLQDCQHIWLNVNISIA